MSEHPFICRRCTNLQTLVDYNDLRAHLRAAHGIRDLAPNDLNLYEIYPGSRYTLAQFRNRLPGQAFSNQSVDQSFPSTSTGQNIHSQAIGYTPMLTTVPHYQMAYLDTASNRPVTPSQSEVSHGVIETIVRQQVSNVVAQEMEAIVEQNNTFQTNFQQENDEFRNSLFDTISEEMKKATKELFDLLVAQLPKVGDNIIPPNTGASNTAVTPGTSAEAQNDDQPMTENIKPDPETSIGATALIADVENIPELVFIFVFLSFLPSQSNIQKFSLYLQVPMETIEENVATAPSQNTGTKPKKNKKKAVADQ